MRSEGSGSPLFSADQGYLVPKAVMRPCFRASWRMAAPNSSSTRTPWRSLDTPSATAALKPSKITRLTLAISVVCSGLNGPCQPNISFENVARWSNGNTYSGLSYPIAMVIYSASLKHCCNRRAKRMGRVLRIVVDGKIIQRLSRTCYLNGNERWGPPRPRTTPRPYVGIPDIQCCGS